jgi:Putative transmembrane protein (PGPGW)
MESPQHLCSSVHKHFFATMTSDIVTNKTTSNAQSEQMDCWEFVNTDLIPGGDSDKAGQEIPARDRVWDENDVCSDANASKNSVRDWVRKTGVAVAGGTMVGVGLIMIPLPTPFGCVVAGSGMAVLGTEFPAAQRVLDRTCKKVADAIEYSSRDDTKDEGEEAIQVCANDKMKEILMQQQMRNEAPLTYNLKQIGRKVAPVIRKIGGGIDKEQLARTSESVTKAATDAKLAVQSQWAKCWNHLGSVDDIDDIAGASCAPTKSPTLQRL